MHNYVNNIKDSWKGEKREKLYVTFPEILCYCREKGIFLFKKIF